MNYLRAFFGSIYGVIFFSVLLMTVACAILALALPVVMQFEMRIDRAGGAAAATATAQSLPTVVPVTFEPSLPPAPVAPTKSVAPPVAPLTVTLAATLALAPPTPTVPQTPGLTPPAVEPTPRASTPAAGASAPPAAATEAQQAELLQLVNQLRLANECSALQREARLAQAAQAHAEDMRDHRRLDHIGSDGATLQDRLMRASYPFQRAGENITSYFATPQDVMKQWTEGAEIPDGPHRKNILNCRYTEAGIGLAYRDDGFPYWVLDLASRRQ